MLFNRDSAIQKCFQKILHSLQVRKSDSLSVVQTTYHIVRTLICPKCQPFGRRVIPSGRSFVYSIIRPDDENFLSGPSTVSRSFELLQLASVRTFQQHVRTTLIVRPKLQDFFPKHRYGKIPDTFRTTWISFCPRSSIRQVS
jgi:hypothetical protein